MINSCFHYSPVCSRIREQSTEQSMNQSVEGLRSETVQYFHGYARRLILLKLSE